MNTGYLVYTPSGDDNSIKVAAWSDWLHVEKIIVQKFYCILFIKI